MCPALLSKGSFATSIKVTRTLHLVKGVTCRTHPASALSKNSTSHWQFTHPSVTLGNRQLMDEVFVISRIIKVEVGVISRSQRLRLITPTSALTILDITKTESINCFIIHWMKKKKWKSCFCFFNDSKQHKAREGELSAEAKGWGWWPLPRPWLFWISQKPNLIIVLLCTERKKMEAMFLLLHWRQAIQGVRTWHDTAVIHGMTTRELECPWHDYCIICS